VFAGIWYGGYKYSTRRRAELVLTADVLNRDDTFSGAKLTVVNNGDSLMFSHSVVQAALVEAPRYSSGEEEQELFGLGPEWTHFSFKFPFLPADLVEMSVTHPVPIDYWNRLRSQQRALYLLAEIYGRDEVGPMEPLRVCWSVSGDDWRHFKPCLGNKAH
jgi:hypothetical protein